MNILQQRLLLVTPTLLTRFWSKVEITPTCWNWKAYKNRDGYGRIRYNKTVIFAHRLLYELFNGCIPKELTIDHLCRNRACVNPDHMQVVTIQENLMRGNGFGAINHKKTHCPQGHEYNEENTYIYEDCRRLCKICHKEHKLIYNSLKNRER